MGWNCSTGHFGENLETLRAEKDSIPLSVEDKEGEFHIVSPLKCDHRDQGRIQADPYGQTVGADRLGISHSTLVQP